MLKLLMFVYKYFLLVVYYSWLWWLLWQWRKRISC